MWALKNGAGSKKACSSGLFGDVTYNMVEPLLRELKVTGKMNAARDHAKQLLTNSERRKLAEWLMACANGHSPKDRTEISSKIKTMLRARHDSNRKKKYGAGSVRLNREEVAVLQGNEPRLSKTFFERFYPWCRAHGIKVSEGVDRAQDEKRATKMTEATVERHFLGEFGLEAELLDAGVMDPDTKVILDPRRLLNSDETPQPIDAPQKGSRPKVAKRQGQHARRSGSVNKEGVSVNMAWDLSGHLYGVQLVLKRKELSDDMVVDAPRGARTFDDETDIVHKQSRYCLLSRITDGMQTQQSFIEYLRGPDVYSKHFCCLFQS